MTVATIFIGRPWCQRSTRIAENYGFEPVASWSSLPLEEGREVRSRFNGGWNENEVMVGRGVGRRASGTCRRKLRNGQGLDQQGKHPGVRPASRHDVVDEVHALRRPVSEGCVQGCEDLCA